MQTTPGIGEELRQLVIARIAEGINTATIARQTGVDRRTIADIRDGVCKVWREETVTRVLTLSNKTEKEKEELLRKTFRKKDFSEDEGRAFANERYFQLLMLASIEGGVGKDTIKQEFGIDGLTRMQELIDKEIVVEVTGGIYKTLDNEWGKNLPINFVHQLCYHGLKHCFDVDQFENQEKKHGMKFMWAGVEANGFKRDIKIAWTSFWLMVSEAKKNNPGSDAVMVGAFYDNILKEAVPNSPVAKARKVESRKQGVVQ